MQRVRKQEIGDLDLGLVGWNGDEYSLIIFLGDHDAGLFVDYEFATFGVGHLVGLLGIDAEVDILVVVGEDNLFEIIATFERALFNSGGSISSCWHICP